MTVYIVILEHWEETDIDGVFESIESAKASVPSGVWVREGDGVALEGQRRGYRVTIQPYEVKP